MQVLIVIIEKEGEIYTGRSPNLLGVSVTGKTRDEVETKILDAMDQRLDELHGMHNNRPPISRLPIEETVGCVYKDAPPSKYKCCQSAKKDGLCLIHWRKLYGHPYGKTLKSCPLCGESEPEILAKYDSPCSFKINNPDWESIFEEMKIKNRSKWNKERDAVKVENLKG